MKSDFNTNPEALKTGSSLEEVRCTCGRLIARRDGHRYETKCPRCKGPVELACACHTEERAG